MRRTSSTAASSGWGSTTWSMRCGLAQQLADLAAVVAGEVRAHPRRAGWWPCRRRAPRPRAVAEEVDAGRAGQRVGEPELGGLGVAGHGGQGEQVVEAGDARAPPARSSRTCSRSPVARASSSARWLGWWSRRKRSARVPSLQLGTSSRTRRRARAHGVDRAVGERGAARSRSSAAWRKPRSKRTLWPTITASPMNSSSVGSTDSMRGAGSTMAWVMPVSTVISGGMAQPGFTRVWNVPRHSPPRSFTAPISVMPQSVGRAAGGLEVDHAERDVVQRRAQVVERELGPVEGGPVHPASIHEHAFAHKCSTDALPTLAHRYGSARGEPRCEGGVGHRRVGPPTGWTAIGRIAAWPSTRYRCTAVRQPHPLRRHQHPPHPRVPPLHGGWRARGSRATPRCSTRRSRRSRAAGAARAGASCRSANRTPSTPLVQPGSRAPEPGRAGRAAARARGRVLRGPHGSRRHASGRSTDRAASVPLLPPPLPSGARTGPPRARRGRDVPQPGPRRRRRRRCRGGGMAVPRPSPGLGRAPRRRCSSRRPRWPARRRRSNRRSDSARSCRGRSTSATRRSTGLAPGRRARPHRGRAGRRARPAPGRRGSCH